MEKVLHPGRISGTYSAPSSKSLSIRAAAAAITTNKISYIRNYSNSDDALAALDIIKSLGADIQNENNQLIITPPINRKKEATLNAGESALCLRLFLPFALNFAENILFDAKGSLLHRDLKIPREVLTDMGINIDNLSFPIKYSGILKESSFVIDSSSTSQWLSGLLFTYSRMQLEKEVVIRAIHLKSRNYIELTIDVIRDIGIEIILKENDTFIVPSFKNYKALNFEIEGDWSSASFFIVAAALTGSLTLHKLNMNSKQADSIILYVLKYSGIKIMDIENAISVKRPVYNPLSFDVDLTDAPDLFPVLSIFAATCTGMSKLKGTGRLLNKESNRLQSICSMLDKFQVYYEISDDYLFIQGGLLAGCEIDPEGDHRIAMAAAVGSLVAAGPVIIINSECVNKSYPEFWQHFNLLKRQA